MRDPLNDLSRIADGVDSPRLPPAEVRRRGDRLRRRRTALQATGAAAAVALVVSGGVLAGGTLTNATPPTPGPATQAPGTPSPTATSPSPSTSPSPTADATPADVRWRTTVPGAVRKALTDSLPEPVEGESPTTDGRRDLPWKGLPCDAADGSSTLTDLDDRRTDQQLAEIQPPATWHGRQLVLYRDGATAAEVVSALRGQTESCGPLESIPSISEFRWSARPYDYGGDEGLLLAGGEYTVDGDARTVGRMLIGVVRQGNAVLAVTLSDESSADLDDLTEPEAANLVDVATGLAEEMCVFTADPCGSGSP